MRDLFFHVLPVALLIAGSSLSGYNYLAKREKKRVKGIKVLCIKI